MTNDITKLLKFEATIQIEKSVSVVRVSGEIDLASAPILAERLREATDEAMSDLRLVVADLTDVTFLDSSGLGVLINYETYANERDDSIDFHLVVSEPQILKVFAITGLDQVMSIFPTVEEATAGLA